MSNLVHEINELHAHLCQAIADPKRILILYTLSDGPRNVTEIAEEYDLPQSTVSRHLKTLRERGLVNTSRQGNSITYSLADPRVIEALDIMRSMLADIINQNAFLAQQVEDRLS